MKKTKDIYLTHQERIKKANKKYPMMEYFLGRKPLNECSEECQKQVAEMNGRLPRFL
jgi:hypothetical protein